MDPPHLNSPSTRRSLQAFSEVTTNVKTLIRSCRHMQDAYRDPRNVWRQSLESGMDQVEETSRQLGGQIYNKKMLLMKPEHQRLFIKIRPQN